MAYYQKHLLWPADWVRVLVLLYKWHIQTKCARQKAFPFMNFLVNPLLTVIARYQVNLCSKATYAFGLPFQPYRLHGIDHVARHGGRTLHERSMPSPGFDLQMLGDERYCTGFPAGRSAHQRWGKLNLSDTLRSILISKLSRYSECSPTCRNWTSMEEGGQIALNLSHSTFTSIGRRHTGTVPNCWACHLWDHSRTRWMT